MDVDKPIIKVGEIVDHDDGTSTITFEVNDAFEQMYLEDTGKKRMTKRGLSNYIKDIIMKANNKQDGYDFNLDYQLKKLVKIIKLISAKYKN